MNYDAITLEDCIVLLEVHNQSIIINNGHITELINDSRRELNTVYSPISE